MNLVQLRIKKTVATTRYGNLSSGDLLRTDAAFARFMVEDIAAAEYITIEQPKTAPPSRRKRKEKPE